MREPSHFFRARLDDLIPWIVRRRRGASAFVKSTTADGSLPAAVQDIAGFCLPRGGFVRGALDCGGRARAATPLSSARQSTEGSLALSACESSVEMSPAAKDTP